MIRRIAIILACCWCASALAQPTPSAPEVEPAVAAATAANGIESQPAQVFVQDAEGRWVAAPAGRDADDGDSLAEAAAAYIAQLQLEGDVAGEYAEMTARVRVELTRDDGWYELPLALDQALVFDSIYIGEGRSAPVVSETASKGMRWQFFGAGTHRLEIRFRLPIRGTAGGRQLQLSLPQLPPNYVTRAVLRVPEAHVVPVEAISGGAVRRRTLESGGTELESDVAGQRWDLAWRTETDDVPQVSKVVTSMRVWRDGGRLRLTATQGYTLEHGGLSELVLRLPSGFDLESVGLAGSSAPSLTVIPDPDRDGWSRLQLGAELQRDFELEWQLQSAFPPPQSVVTVDGLEVDGARVQWGRIEVEAIPGYAARYRADDSVALLRGDVGERRADDPVYDFRFDFQRQPCTLTYELTPVEAMTHADTEVFLSIDADRSELYLALDVDVLSGQVHELVIDWPGYASSGWRAGFARADVAVDSGGAAIDLVNATLDPDALTADPDQLRLQLSRACTGSLSSVLRFVRVSPPGSGSMDLVLPQPAATFQHARALNLASAVNLETTVSLPSGSPSLVPRSGPLPAEVPLRFDEPDVLAFALPAEPGPLTIGWSKQARSISAETTLSVERLKPDVLKLVQTVDYDVKYGYVSTLTIDTSVAASARGGTGADAEWRVESDGIPLETEIRDSLLRVTLPGPRRGQLSVNFERVLAAPAASAAGQDGIAIPVLQSVDAPFSSTVLRFPDAGPLRLADPDHGWQPWLTRSGDSAWRTTAPQQTVQLVIDDTSDSLQQQFTIATAFVQTWFGEPGQTIVHAEYVLQNAPGRVALTLPEPSSAAEFRWEGTDLATPGRVRTAVDAPSRYIVTLSEQDDAPLSGRLTVRYRTPRPGRTELLSAYIARFPRFGEQVVIDDSYWEIVLPADQQLSAPPAGLVPQYTWERESAMWARRLTPAYRALRQQLAQDERDPAPRGNVYAYTAIGPLPQGQFGGMARSLIVLIGAGFSLLLGFIFRSIPATRNLLSVLVLGFLFALFGVWRLELMQLLLQPALLGLLLAAIAASFDVVRRDHRGLRKARLESLQPVPERRSSPPSLGSSVPARTALYHPEVSEPGRSG